MSEGLAVTDLRKEYPTPTQPLVVLAGITLNLRPGQSLAIVGPSGSGKSTLLSILGSLEQPTSGTVRLDGVDPFSLKPAELAEFRGRRIGFIFQDHHLLPQCTAIENVLLARLALGKISPADIDRAHQLLGRVELSDREEHLPSQLSGGQRQRVAIARALMNQPTLLLCDEPTGNLDQKTAGAVGELLVEVSKEAGAITVVVTHSDALAGRFAGKVRLEEGRLV